MKLDLKDSTKGISLSQEHELQWRTVIPKEYKYFGDVFKSLPKGCFINKTLTGSGATTLGLIEDTKMIIAVPRLLLVKNKLEQHPHLFGVHGKVLQKDLEDSVGKTQKYITTYDSLGRLIDALGEHAKEYHLLVDEVHVLVRESGEFRSAVCNNLFNCVGVFKDVTYLTATPTDPKYLPPALASIPFLTVEWESSSKVEIKKCRVNNDLNTKALSVVLDIIDGDKGKPFVFYNSLTGIISIIKSLQKIRKWTHNDIKIVCADTPENTKRLHNSLGKEWVPQSPVTVDKDGNQLQESHRVVFITKACFEGVDFYCKQARTIIISDAKRKYKDFIKLDISIDLPQIIGRFRDQLPEYRKEVIFLWTESFHGHHLNEDDYKEMVNKQISEAPTLLQQYDTNFAGAKEALYYAVKSSVYCLAKEDGSFDINPLAYYAMMSAYEAQKADFHVQVDGGDISKGEVKLDRLFDTNNYSIPDLSVLDKKAMNRSISYQKLLKEYCEAIESEEDKDSIQYLEEIAPELPDIVSVVGIDRIRGYSFVWKHIQTIYYQALGITNIRANRGEAISILGLNEGYFYSFKELKDKVGALYSHYGVQAVAKATDVQDYFECKKTNKRGQNGYLILGVKK